MKLYCTQSHLTLVRLKSLLVAGLIILVFTTICLVKIGHLNSFPYNPISFIDHQNRTQLPQSLHSILENQPPFRSLKQAIPRSVWYYSPWELKRQIIYKYDCPVIYDGNLTAIYEIKKQLKRSPYRQASAEEVYHWAKNCTNVSKYYNIRTKYVTMEEYEYPVAFSIRMHQSVEQAEQLLRHLYSPQNFYCIYIDKKSPKDIHKAMQQIASCFDNVFIASKLEDFHYSTISHISADLQCMEDALRISSSWKYFINLIGEDFLIKTKLDLVRMLKLLNGSNGIHSQGTSPALVDQRIRNVYKVVDGVNTKTNKRRPPFDNCTTFYKGAEYNVFSREFVNWTLHADYPVRLYNYLKNGTHASDELYWATLNRQPSAPGHYLYDADRYSKARIWSYSKNGQRDFYPCRGSIVRSICILSVTELSWLASQPEPLANKFKIDDDPIAMDCLGQHITYRHEKGMRSDLLPIKMRPVIYDKVFYKD